MTVAVPLSVDVVSDVVCPWCFIGKRRLEKAAGISAVPLGIRWRPYQLDPTIPPEGKSRRAYLEGKFGSLDRIRTMHERIAEIGAAEGIAFAFDRIAVSPNTLDAHRLIHWAKEAGAEGAVVEALFRAYFVEGRDIGDHAVLAEVAAAAEMDGGAVASRLASSEDREAVRQEIDWARQIGITGVPTFILAGRYALVGAQPAETIAEAIVQLAGRESGQVAAF
jgi:predicted DsbA family dithiol-disulfide isomerase